MAQGAVISNLNGLAFEKGFMYGTDYLTNDVDAVTFGALGNVTIDHEWAFSEIEGPESLSPLGVGIKSETVRGTWEYGVLSPAQLQMAFGGTTTYDPVSQTTTYTKGVNDEPLPFDLHLKSSPTNPDVEIHLYQCLAPTWNIFKANNREFAMGQGSFRAYGQSVANGGKLFTVIRPGNLTTSS